MERGKEEINCPLLQSVLGVTFPVRFLKWGMFICGKKNRMDDVLLMLLQGGCQTGQIGIGYALKREREEEELKIIFIVREQSERKPKIPSKDFNVKGIGKNETKIEKLRTYYKSNPKKITTISCGYDHSLLRSTDGNVFAFGNGFNGKLGNGLNEVETSPIKVMGLKRVVKVCVLRLLIRTNSNFASQVCAGKNHSVALDEFNSVYVWGKGSDLGLGMFVFLYCYCIIWLITYNRSYVCG